MLDLGVIYCTFIFLFSFLRLHSYTEQSVDVCKPIKTKKNTTFVLWLTQMIEMSTMKVKERKAIADQIRSSLKKPSTSGQRAMMCPLFD